MAEDFHKKCDKKGPTITLIKSERGRLFGGFTMVSWSSMNEDKMGKTQNPNKHDREAFLFSIDNDLQFKVNDPSKAVNHCESLGPSFGDDELSILSEYQGRPINRGICNPQMKIFKVGLDQNGCSKLTGADIGNNFTCMEIEVFCV